MLGDFRIDDITAQHFKAFKGALLVRSHQARIPGDICRHDCGQPALDALSIPGVHDIVCLGQAPLKPASSSVGYRVAMRDVRTAIECVAKYPHSHCGTDTSPITVHFFTLLHRVECRRVSDALCTPPRSVRRGRDYD